MLQVEGLSKTFSFSKSKKIAALSHISFVVKKNEFVSIVGPSGCGKTTLLMCIDGLMTPSSGTVYLNEELITAPPRNMVLIFQDYSSSLFPWLSVMGNVVLGLHNKKLPLSEKKERARDSLNSVGLLDFADSYPWQLSGGMQQRAAIARGLAYGSEIILMDEPFASVDAQTRIELEDVLLQVWEKYEKTIVFVTHDIDEAVYLSDRVLILSNRPSELVDEISTELQRPRNQIHTRAQTRFIELRNHIYAQLKIANDRDKFVYEEDSVSSRSAAN